MPLVAHVSGNLLRYPFFSAFHRPPEAFVLEGTRGVFTARRPLPGRGGYLYLGLLALANGEQELVLPRYRLLSSLSLKLYNQDLCQLLVRLTTVRLTFEGCFYDNGRFVNRGALSLLEGFEEEKGRLRFRFPAWVWENTFTVDVSLLRGLSPLARRLYLYFAFALSRGSFRLSFERLCTLVPALTSREVARLREGLPLALQALAEAGVISYEHLPGERLFIAPGPHFQELKALRASRPNLRATYSANRLILGRAHAGKSSRLKKLRQQAESFYGLKALYLPALYPVSDWLHLNFAPEELKGLTAVEKRSLIVEAASRRLVLVDDLDRLSGQKQELVKECLKRAPIFAVSARFYQAIPEALRLTLEKKGFREENLKSEATRDLTFAVLAGLVFLAALAGHHEWLLAFLAVRLLLRQPL